MRKRQERDRGAKMEVRRKMIWLQMDEGRMSYGHVEGRGKGRDELIWRITEEGTGTRQRGEGLHDRDNV